MVRRRAGDPPRCPGVMEHPSCVVEHLADVDAEAGQFGLGVDVSEVFHDAGGVFYHAGTDGRVAGPAPEHQSYGSFISFSDPDGNGWCLQEITTRLPGR